MRISHKATRVALVALLSALVLTMGQAGPNLALASESAPPISVEAITRLLEGRAAQECNAAFKLAEIPTFDTSKNELRGVTTFAPDNVWAVGIAGGETLIQHWDGAKWSRVESPNPGVYRRLDGISGTGPDDIWAVGWHDTNPSFAPLALHWDGSKWSAVDTPHASSDSRLYSVFAISQKDVWAVGMQNNRNMIMHWDGSAWSIVNSPDMGARSELNSVVAIGTNDVWAVGGAGEKTLTMHWDGAAWTTVPSPNAHNYDRLYSVAAYGSDVWAAGGVILRWDGKAWSISDTPAEGTAYRGITALGANDVWAGGYGKPGGGVNKNMVRRWDGKAWADVASLSPSGDGNQINDLDGSSPGDIWAVGNVGPSQSFQPSVQHYVDPCATPAATPGTKPAAPPVALPGSGSQLFTETGKTVKGLFLDYWNNHGGLAQQGYPVSDLIGEKSDLDGKTYTVQYFQRAVFEYHPENSAPNNVLLTQLGTYVYKDRYADGAPNQTPNTGTGSRLFSETGKRLGGRFLEYWNANGGLAQQGLPISDEFQEKSATDGKTYLVQYFERAVFEYHPENQGPYDVLLSLLGSQRWVEKYGGY